MKVRELLPKRRWIIGLGLLVAFGVSSYVGLMAFLDWRARSEWAEACAEADRLDPGWRWEDLVAKSPTGPGERNGADHVATAFQMIEAWPTGAGKNSPNIKFGLANSPSQHRPPAAVVAAIGAILSQGQPIFDEIDRVSECPTGWIPLPPSPVLHGQLPSAYMSIQVIRSICLRLLLRADQGDADDALADARLMLAVAGPSVTAPALLHNVVAGADWVLAVRGIERALAQGQPSVAALAVTRRLVETESVQPLLLSAFRGDRAGIFDTFRALDDGRLTRDEVAGSGLFKEPVTLTGWKSVDGWFTHVTGADLRRSKGLAMFKHHTQVIEWLKESPDGLRIHEAEWAAFRARMTGTAQIQAASLARFAGDVREAAALMRCAAAALAAEQFRRETGRWPAVLTELVPNYLSRVPRDPCDLRPMRLARRPDGLVIYSVGEDGTDEGGAIASDGAAKATDIGVRLWDVAQRRQPPLPPNASPNPPAPRPRN